MLKHKKCRPDAGTSEAAKANNSIRIIHDDGDTVNPEVETWSPALDYWCRRENDELPDDC